MRENRTDTVGSFNTNLHMPKQQATPRRPDKVFQNTVDSASMIRARLFRSSYAISKSKRFPVLLPLLDCNSVISKPHYSKSFSTDSSVGPFVGSDDHVVRVVNRKGNAFRQARVHWLLASLVISVTPLYKYMYSYCTYHLMQLRTAVDWSHNQETARVLLQFSSL